MNYMLLENKTLSSMKAEHFEYVKSNKPDPPPNKSDVCHSDMVTQVLVLMRENDSQKSEQGNVDTKKKQGSLEARKKVQFVTGSRDGTVKVWNGLTLTKDMQINVGKSWVTAIAYMTFSRRLVAACANRS